jgi:hypothetical protein
VIAHHEAHFAATFVKLALEGMLISGAPMSSLILKRALASRPSGQWSDDDFDVLADGAVVGRIFKANAAPVGSPWMWTLAFGHPKIERRHTTMRSEGSRDGRVRKKLAAQMKPIHSAARISTAAVAVLCP